MTAPRWRAAFVAASSAWALLLFAAPFAASRSHASLLASALIVGVYSIGSLVCHQLPERSYHIWTAQMPVCARCAGIYVGAAGAAVFAATFRKAEALRHSAALRQRPTVVAQGFSPARIARTVVARGFSPVRVALVLAAAPTLLTLVYEWSTGDRPSHPIRAAAGVPIGVAVAWLVVAAAHNQVN
jgi:hypothetical protein